MNCVSYTRATCCRTGDNSKPAPIMEQNERIRKFIRSRKWKLVGRYSDRKHDPEAESEFLKMREDGINRKFECVVIDSLWQCGINVFQAVSLLRKTFYPAGIHFAVVEEDFCSADVDDKAVEVFLEKAWGAYHGRETGERLGMHTVLRHLTMFGYVYDRKTNTLRIDETSAAIVREIFERTAAGEKPISIARDLTSRNVETPGHYMARMNNDFNRVINPNWTSIMVHNVFKNPKYCGRWERIIDGKNLSEEVGCIVSPELYEAAAAQIKARNYTKQETHTPPSPMAGRMWDKESNLALVKYSNCYRGITDIRFRYPKEKDIRYEKISMDYEEFLKRAAAELRREKQECLNVYDILHSDVGKAFVDQMSEDARKPVPGILKQFGDIEGIKMSCYIDYQNGDITEIEYKRKKAAYMAQLSRLDREIESIMKKLDSINRVYSDKNPWIALYRYMDETAELDRKQAMKYIEKILVYRFESLEMIPYHKEAKEAFPAEWLKGGSHGTVE